MEKSGFKDSDSKIDKVNSNLTVYIDQDGNRSTCDQLLKRDLKKRHVSMMAIASALGTGLLIGAGTALQRGGPGSLLLGYLFSGSLLLTVLFSLGEMAAFSPMDKAFSGYCTRYCDKALGFAAGWNYWFYYGITLPSELSAVGIVIQYWRPDLNTGIFVTVFLVVVVFVNWFDVRVYGEIEFWVSIVKLLTLAICFVTAIVVSAGGAPNNQSIGFQYWSHGTAFLPYIFPGSKGKFLGWWACVIQSIYAYSGCECIGIVFGEAPDPKKSIPLATKQAFLRIGVVYIIGVLIMGISVSPLNPNLGNGNSNASASPFVIAFQSAKIRVLPSFVNACLLFFIGGSANSDVYLASRSLYGLARDGMAPKIFLKLNKNGNPYWASTVSSLYGLLAYMTTRQGSADIFNYLTSAVSVFGLITWINILLSYITFYHATVAQNVPRDEIPFRMWFQPYPAYAALFFVCVITFFNGYDAFTPKFNYKNFLTSYVGVFVYLFMLIGYKIYAKTERVTKYNARLYNYTENVVSIDDQLASEDISI